LSIPFRIDVSATVEDWTRVVEVLGLALDVGATDNVAVETFALIAGHDVAIAINSDFLSTDTLVISMPAFSAQVMHNTIASADAMNPDHILSGLLTFG